MKTVVLLDRESAATAPNILGLQVRIRGGGVKPALFVHGASQFRRQLRLGHDTVVVVPEDVIDVEELARVCGEHGYRVQRLLLTDIAPKAQILPAEPVEPVPVAAVAVPVAVEPVPVAAEPEPVVAEPEPETKPGTRVKTTKAKKKDAAGTEASVEEGTVARKPRKKKATSAST